MLKNAFLGRRDEPVSAPVVNSRPALGTRMTASVLAAMVRVSAMSAAAYVADVFNLTTPADIEQKLRDWWYPIINPSTSSVRLDAASQPVRMVRIY